jgi:putative transcription factor
VLLILAIASSNLSHHQRGLLLYLDNNKQNLNINPIKVYWTLRCEVCGRKIHGEPINALIEGAKLTVCVECSKHGKIVHEGPKTQTVAPRPTGAQRPLSVQIKKAPEVTVDTSIELVEGYSDKIRQAREKLGLSHDDLGKKLNEKVSLLRKIETGKMAPDNNLATRLERALKIKLIVPAAEEKIPQAKTPRTSDQELTLGDLMDVNNKNKEEKREAKERRPS